MEIKAASTVMSNFNLSATTMPSMNSVLSNVYSLFPCLPECDSTARSSFYIISVSLTLFCCNTFLKLVLLAQTKTVVVNPAALKLY